MRQVTVRFVDEVNQLIPKAWRTLLRLKTHDVEIMETVELSPIV